MPDFEKIWTDLVSLVVTYVPSVIMALIVLVIGWLIISQVMKWIRKGLENSNLDEAIQKFAGKLINIGLRILLIISAAAMVGIETTSFIAVIGAAGLAIGLALQGSLSNFAGGILILLFKPFKIGDFIEAESCMGTIKEIQLFNTVMLTGDNKTVIIPNAKLSNGIVTNYSSQETRRVELVFSIGYKDDIQKAKQIISDITEAEELVLKEPAIQLVVNELADSSVNLRLRFWCATSDYWDLYFKILEQVKLTFDSQGISIPFPQQDVHLIQPLQPHLPTEYSEKKQ